MRNLLERLESRQLYEPALPLILAGLVGLASGIGVWLFKQGIVIARWIFFDQLGGALAAYGDWTVALLPVSGGLIVGLIGAFLVGHERHHGVAGIMEAVALAGGRLRYKRVPAKILAAALSIGSGASVGPEDPSVQIGSNLGSMAGQVLRLSDDRVRALVASGAAAGVAAAFNAPIAGVFFALEIILGEISVGALSSILVASVASSIFTQAVSGPQPAFHVPAYEFGSILELPFYLVLGLLAGLVSALYVRVLYLAQDVFQSWKAPRWVKPVAAGLIVGLTGIFLPQVFGVGYETLEQILANQVFSAGFLLALLAAKLLMTGISIGGGFMGGVFAPSLFLGAVLGAAFCTLANLLFPGLPLATPAFAMVGMGAVLAGAVHAPMTAILLLFEMTNDYRIILPLMFAVVISLLAAEYLQRDSVYTLGLARKGIRLERGRDVEVMQAITVREVMAQDPPTLRVTDSLTQAAAVLDRTRRHGLPVLDEKDRLVGMCTIHDLDLARSDGKTGLMVGDVCTRDLITAFPDETLGDVLRRMSTHDIGRIPVVSREDPGRLVGLLHRRDLIRAYNLALSRRTALRHRAQQVRLGALSDEQVHIAEIVVEENSACDGRRVQDISWPLDCVIATIRRGHRFLIPHGGTVLHQGDVLVVATEESARSEVERLCRSATGDARTPHSSTEMRDRVQEQ